MAEIITFIVLGLILIASAGFVVISKNIFHSALFLMLFLFTMAGMFVHLKAELVAVIQVLAYVGGVTTFILFVIMLTNKVMDLSIARFNKQMVMSIVVMAALFISFLILFCLSFLHPLNFTPSYSIMDMTSIGKLLVSDYIVSFEMISVILTVSMIGAIILVKKEGP